MSLPALPRLLPSTEKNLALAKLGITTEEIPEKFLMYYPAGFEIVWIDNPKGDPRLGHLLGLLETIKKMKITGG